ncbi:MAG: hypothetical protein GX595_18775, partial [Lentisphaerae bacterium]|nr:hypothetical protein [Lentisphaerota bacterium]
MAGTRYSLRQLLVGLVAVVVIVCCGLYVHRQWQRLDPKRARRGPPTAAQRWHLSQSGGAGLTDAASVVDWRLSAQPAMAPADTPPVVQRSGVWSSYSLDDSGTRHWRLPEVRPAVAIAVDVVLTSSDGKAPSLWPGLAALRLLRGESPDGPFRPVSEVPRDQAAQGVPERSVRVGSAEPLYTHRIVVFDLNPDLSAVQSYRIQMLGAGGEVLEESGPFTGWAMAAPEAQAESDAQGLLVLKWKAPTLPADRFVGQPHLVTGLSSPTHYLAFDALNSGFDELGRFPVAAGEFTVPVPTGDRNSNLMVAQFAVIGATRRQTWSRSRGPAEDTVLVGVSAVVAGRGGQPALSEARPDQGALALTPRRVDHTYAGNQRGTAFTVYPRVFVSATLESLVVRYAKRGTTKAITTPTRSSYEEPVGLGERCVYTLTVRDGDATKTLTASAYSPPAPVGFGAITAPNAIRLLWDPLVIETDEWATPPELVVRRLATTDARAPFSNAVSLSVHFVEIARLPATATEFTDRQVRPGDEYFYALDLEGVVRATCTVGDRRDIAINLPVRCGSGLNGTWAPLLVKAEISGPVRVAVSTDMLRGTDAETARAAMEAGLRCEPWIRLVERSDAGQLLDEGHLTAFGKGEAQAGTAGPAPAVQAADVVVDCRMHGDVRTPRNEVGLTDVGRQQREVLGSWAAHETPWAEVAAAVVSRLKAQFPDWEQRAARAAAPADAPARLTLAVMALEPLIAACDDTLPPGTLEGLLAVALSESGRWEVVDREHLAAVMAEQGLTAASGSSKALALGRLVHADAVVTGTYTLKQGRIGLAGRLVSVASGHHLATLEVAGSRDDLEALAGQFADAAAEASLETAPATTDSATRRTLEMRASTGGLNTLAAAKTAAYVGGGDLTTLTQLGEAYAQRNQTEEALNCFRQALDLAEEENPTDAMGVSRIHGLRMTMDELLRRLGRPRERATLWQRAAARAAGEALDGRTSLMLAAALSDVGEPEAALAALRRAKEPHQDSRAGILFATLGDVPAAVDTLARARWIEPGRTVTYDREDTVLGPGYATVVRLLALAPPEAR